MAAGNVLKDTCGCRFTLYYQGIRTRRINKGICYRCWIWNVIL